MYAKTVRMLSDVLVHFHRMLHCKLKSLFSLSLSFLPSSFFPLFFLLFYIPPTVLNATYLLHIFLQITLLSPNFTFGCLIWMHYAFPVVFELAIFLLLNTHGLC